jgi:PadR family transcriptional regulator, regulatory protein AphA
MSLPHALLGLLNYRPATGYELKKTFTQSIHFFWNATLPQIYRTLKQMEKQDWLTVSIEHQDGKPSRKVYQVTDQGRAEFQRWLMETPEIPETRNAMLIKIFFGKRMDSNQFANQLRQWREYHSNLLRRYEEEIVPLVNHYATKTGASKDVPYWTLTLEFGRRQAKMVVDWCDAALGQMMDVEGEKSRQQKGGSCPKKGRRKP